MHQRQLKEDDYEGQMAKAQLMKIENYAKKLNDMIHDQDELEAWVQAKLSVVAAYMGDIKHYLDYELEKAGEKIENKEEIDELFKDLYPATEYGRYKVEPSTYEDDVQEAKEILKGVWELMSEKEQKDMVIKMKKNGIIGLPGLEEDIETYSAMQYAKGGVFSHKDIVAEYVDEKGGETFYFKDGKLFEFIDDSEDSFEIGSFENRQDAANWLKKESRKEGYRDKLFFKNPY